MAASISTDPNLQNDGSIQHCKPVDARHQDLAYQSARRALELLGDWASLVLSLDLSFSIQGGKSSEPSLEFQATVYLGGNPQVVTSNQRFGNRIFGCRRGDNGQKIADHIRDAVRDWLDRMDKEVQTLRASPNAAQKAKAANSLTSEAAPA